MRMSSSFLTMLQKRYGVDTPLRFGDLATVLNTTARRKSPERINVLL
jgi:hypothetical protein